MSYINTQATSSYKEALQATESIEAPALGFCRPANYKSASGSIEAFIKQANTQIQLLVTILEKLESLEERIKRLEAKEQTASIPDTIIQELSSKINSLSIKDKPREGKGKLRVFKDPYIQLQEKVKNDIKN